MAKKNEKQIIRRWEYLDADTTAIKLIEELQSYVDKYEHVYTDLTTEYVRYDGEYTRFQIGYDDIETDKEFADRLAKEKAAKAKKKEDKAAAAAKDLEEYERLKKKFDK